MGFSFQSETDWVKFIKPCLDVIEKISNLLPEESLANCVSLRYILVVFFYSQSKCLCISSTYYDEIFHFTGNFCFD